MGVNDAWATCAIMLLDNVTYLAYKVVEKDAETMVIDFIHYHDIEDHSILVLEDRFIVLKHVTPIFSAETSYVDYLDVHDVFSAYHGSKRTLCLVEYEELVWSKDDKNQSS